MPPEDITILRMVGSFTVSLSAALANWTLGLMVVDATWTPASLFSSDADKRVLWHQTYVNNTGAASLVWSPPDQFETSGGARARTEASRLDISPKVRLEQGKALKLVWWENAGGAELNVNSADMRVLYQRTRR